MNTIRDAVKCQRCGEAVTFYEHRTKFIFVGRERIVAGHSAALSCGCEIAEYDIDIDDSYEEMPVRLFDALTQETVLEFNDFGPNNNVWDDES